ncbi:uncharacterized protein [Argopecten irradians]|uniref:uncharacterized protein n=1 Tax=Argopecten irradians TaxID=31199 RepID=UPI00371041F2
MILHLEEPIRYSIWSEEKINGWGCEKIILHHVVTCETFSFDCDWIKNDILSQKRADTGIKENSSTITNETAMATTPTNACITTSLTSSSTNNSTNDTYIASPTTPSTTSSTAFTPFSTTTTASTHSSTSTTASTHSSTSTTASTHSSTSTTASTHSSTSTTASTHSSTSTTASTHSSTSTTASTHSSTTTTASTHSSTSTTASTPFNNNNNTTTHTERCCSCVTKRPITNLTTAQLQSAIDKLKSELSLNKATLSSVIRKKTCATDNRPSSAVIGMTGAVFLAIPFVLLIFCDITRLFVCRRQRILVV